MQATIRIPTESSIHSAHPHPICETSVSIPAQLVPASTLHLQVIMVAGCSCVTAYGQPAVLRPVRLACRVSQCWHEQTSGWTRSIHYAPTATATQHVKQRWQQLSFLVESHKCAVFIDDVWFRMVLEFGALWMELVLIY